RIKLARYNLLNQPWVVEAAKQEGGLVWKTIQADQLSSGGDNTEMVLPIDRAIYDFNSNDILGYIQVNLNGRKIIDKINEMKLGETGSFFVVNEVGKIMVSADVDAIGSSVANTDLLAHIVNQPYVEFEFQQDNVDYYGVKQQLSNGWLLV